MSVPAKDGTSLLTQTPLEIEGRLLPNDSGDCSPAPVSSAAWGDFGSNRADLARGPSLTIFAPQPPVHALLASPTSPVTPPPSQLPASLPRSDSARLLLAHTTVWFLSAVALLPGLDRFADMHELYAWGMAPQWGTYKHPPLLSWLVGAWFRVFPAQDWAFHLLAVLNATLSVWLIGRFTREVLEPDPGAVRWSQWAMAGAALALSYGNLALKLNMNTVLLPLWPLVAWAWWRSVRRATAWRAVALGLAAALCLLGKYYSGVMLLCLLFASLACAPGRAWLLTPAPYISLAVFVAALLPHGLWVARHDFITLRYLNEQGGEAGFSMVMAAKFIAMALISALIAAAVLGWTGRPWRRDEQLRAWRGALIVLAAGPAAVSLALTAALDIELSSPWALPLGFAFAPLVLAWARPERPWPELRRSIIIALCVYWALMMAGAGVGDWRKAQRADAGYYLAREELAQAIAQAELQPAWVGGDWQYAAALSFYSKQHPHAIPGLPGQGGAAVHTPAAWASQTGLIVCPVASETQTHCLAQAQAWARARGLATQQTRTTVRRQGWRFPLDVPSDFDLLWVRPQPPSGQP